MSRAAPRRGLSQLWALGWALLLCWAMPALAQDPQQACTPTILATTAARASADAETPPQDGWESVTLPDLWKQRWPDHQGAVWYRIDWLRGCPDGAPTAPFAGQAPLGLGIGSMQMAGAVYLNQDLLWRDASLTEPLSMGWNTPRWWSLPEAALRPGLNTIWVRVVCPPELSPGLGHLRIGAAEDIEAWHSHSHWRQRTAYLLTAGLSGAVGCVFLVVWFLRRQELAFGWYALMSLCWMVYLATVLATRPWPLWPFDSAVGMSRLNLIALLGYVLCFCLFTFRFGAQHLPRTERWLKALTALAMLAMLLAPPRALYATSLATLLWCALVFLGNCLQFQRHAWWPRGSPRKREHQWLALCWLLFLVVGLHDLLSVLNAWGAHDTWAPVTGPVTTLFMALLLGGQLAASMRRIERFNQELADNVEQARAELARALAREHASELENTRLHTMQQERTQLAQDLHDGLGASLVRSMAVAEQAHRSHQPLPGDRVMALFKQLRDDLRQVIDYGSSATASPPASPELWVAPLRHRFVHILDELGLASEWHFTAAWHGQGPQPSMLQCLGLSRILEEALTNVIKHSRARRIQVRCDTSTTGWLRLQIEDDGQGFDTTVAQHTGLSVGLRSMAARAARLGGSFSVQSAPGRTVVHAEVPLHQGH